MMDCACSMGTGSMTWMMLLPALILAGLVIGGIVLVRRLWSGAAPVMTASRFGFSRSVTPALRSIATSSTKSVSI